MAAAGRLEADTAQIRAGSRAVAAAAGYLEAVPVALARTASGTDSAAPGSATASTWTRLDRHCRIAADAEADGLRAFRDVLVASAARYDDTERRIAAAATRRHLREHG